MPFIPNFSKVSDYRLQQLTLTRKWSGLEINYGADQLSGNHNLSNVAGDLQLMWNLGFRKIRIAGSNYGYTAGVDDTFNTAVLAKAFGFYVMWGVGNNPGGFAPDTDANWPAYIVGVTAAADRAQTAGFDEFIVGNEIEYSETVTHQLTSSVQKIKDLATVVKGHFSGVVSYSVAQSAMDYVGAPGGWIETGKGSLDLLAYNVYGDSGSFESFKQKITTFYGVFGSNMYISEWNLAASSSQFPTTESDQGIALGQRLDFIISSGVPRAHFFTFRSDVTTGTTAFALRVGSRYRIWSNYLLNRTALTRTPNTQLRTSAIGLRSPSV